MINKKALFASLFAIAVGVGVVFAVRDRSAPAAVEAVPVAAAPAPFTGARTKAQAMEALMALPELKAWSAHVEKSSGGVSHGALIEYGPTPKAIGEKRYWQLSYVENTPDAAHRWESFLVGENTAEILVEDMEGSQPITLEQWRRDRKPMARTSAN